MQNNNQRENLGPAERILNTLLTFADHAVHNRPGLVSPDPRSAVGVKWEPVTHKEENGVKNVYRLQKIGRRETKTLAGVMDNNRRVTNGNAVVGEYRPAGIFPEVAAWMYRQVADVWRMDNEFAARWASFAFAQEHRDLKVVLAAFMLVQSRKGDPVIDGGKIAFHDDDFRSVGEAMLLLRRKDGRDLNPKLLLRVRDLLRLPAVAQINRELGFGRSARHAFLGRWPSAVEKWLRHREDNPKLLTALVKAGFRTQVMELARSVGYKPTTAKFFEVLRWKQKQSEDGRRNMAIGAAVSAAETWTGLNEEQVCRKIVTDKPNWKRLVSLLPTEVGVTRAVFAAAIEAGCLSDKDLVILTPTIEELGLMEVQEVRERWERAVKASEDQRAANIARNVRSNEVKDKLQEGADVAAQKAVEEVVRDLEVYVLIDASGSMQGTIEVAKGITARLVQSFPLNRVHVAYFNTVGREVAIKHASTAGVENAFRGISASGGTDYGSGVRALQHHKPAEGRDAIMLIIGDEEAQTFTTAVRNSGINPLAFGFLKTRANGGAAGWRAGQYGVDNNVAVRNTAAELGIPCFMIDEAIFADPYLVPRTIRALVAATPASQVVGRATPPRQTLVDQILATDLLNKPAWA